MNENLNDLVQSCKACKEKIVWMRTKNGKTIPVNLESLKTEEVIFNPKAGMIAHFATCPFADNFRRKKKAGTA